MRSRRKKTERVGRKWVGRRRREKTGRGREEMGRGRSGRKDGRRIDQREQEIEKRRWKGRSREESRPSGWMRGRKGRWSGRLV